MAELLRMPEVAAGADSAVLSAWPLPAGTSYATGDVLAVIETDKAVVDVEAEQPGVMLRPLVTEGAEVPIGAPIALLAGPDEQVDDVESLVAELLGTQTETPGNSDLETSDNDTAATEPDGAGPGSVSQRIFASPLARRLAREAGIALESVVGTGPHGRIRRMDIEAALAEREATAATPPGASPPPVASPSTRATPPPTDGTDVDEAIPHTRLRRAIATRLVQSKKQAPHFYLRGSAQVDRLLQMRQEINHGATQRVSVTDLLLKAMAVALAAVPEANVLWTDEAIVRPAGVDIGLAVAADTGLVTPVVRNIHRLTLREVAARTADLAARARSGGLRQHELEGGTTSLTNLGMYGTEDFDAIINPPQSSILAVGAGREVPVVADGQVTVATVIRFSLSVDHRPIDGATAARWMAAFVDLLEHPAAILA